MRKLYVVLLILVLAITVGVLFKSNLELRKSNKELQQTVAKANKADQKAVKTITKIQEKIKYVKEDCDCFHRNIPEEILKDIRG